MRRDKTITRILNAKTIADATSSVLRAQEEDVDVAQVNPQIGFKMSMISLLSIFGITKIDDMSDTQRLMVNKGIILLKFAAHGVFEAAQILRNNACSIGRLTGNKFGLIKAVNESDFLFQQEDVAAFLAAEDIRIADLSKMDPDELSEMSLPDNVPAYAAKVRDASVNVIASHVNARRLKASGIPRSYLNLYGSMEDVNNYINERRAQSNKAADELNEKIVRTKKEDERSLQQVSVMSELQRKSVRIRGYAFRLMVLKKRLQTMLTTALKKGMTEPMARIIRAILAKIKEAEHELKEMKRDISRYMMIMGDLIAPEQMVPIVDSVR